MRSRNLLTVPQLSFVICASSCLEDVSRTRDELGTIPSKKYKNIQGIRVSGEEVGGNRKV